MARTVQDQAIMAPRKVEDEPLSKGAPRRTQPENHTTRLRREVQAAVIAGVNGNTPFVSLLTDLSTRKRDSDKSGAQQLLEQADLQREAGTNEIFGFFLQQAIQGSDPAIVQKRIQDARTEDQVLAADPTRGTKQYVASMAQPPLSAEAREDLEVNLEILDKILPIAQAITGIETAFDLFLQFIPPVTLVDNGQLTGSFTSIFENKQTIKRTIGYFRGLSPEQKRQQFPTFLEMSKVLRPNRRVQFLTALVDPASEEAALEPFGFWTLAETAIMGAGIVSGVIKIMHNFNAIKVAAKAGDKEVAADINLVLMQAADDALGDSMGIKRLTAMDNADPFKGSTYNPAAEDLISPAVHERIFAFKDKARAMLNDIAEGRSFARESFLSDKVDLKKAERRLREEYDVYVAARFQGKDKMVKLTGTTDNPRGVNFEFEITSPDGTVLKDIYKGSFVRDDVGMFHNLGTGSFFLSEKAQAAKTDFFGTVLAAIRLDNAQATVAAQLRKLVKEASKPIRKLKGEPKLRALLSRKERIKQVDSVLTTGDEIVPGGREFTLEELKAGVNGIKLADDQIEVYYNMRAIMRNLGILRGVDVRNDMVQRGVKEIFFKNGKLGFGEVIKDIEIAKRRLTGSTSEDIHEVFFSAGKASRPMKVADLDIDQAYAMGMRLVRLENDIKFSPHGRYRHVLARVDDIRPLPAIVVDLRKGYIPRINPKAVYFVQAFSPSHLDGAADTTRKAIRSFDNKKEAELFAAQFDNVKDLQGFGKKTDIRVVADEELEAFAAGDTGLSGVHGLIHSPRARTPIPHGTNGTVDNIPRMSALESIELYLQNTASFLTRNEWRMGVQTKWERTARFRFPGNKDISFANPGKALGDAEMRNAHEKIAQFSGFMDKGERRWEQMVRSVHEFAIDNIPRGRITDLLLKARRKDPVAGIRSLTFHNLLGMFNPIQLWVQAQGAAVAFSMNIFNPVELAKVFRQMHVMALIQRAKPGMLSKQQMQKIAKIGGFKNADEMLDTKKLWDQSGLFDSVMSSADVEAAARGFPTTMGSLRNFADSGLMFFRTGELFNRRMGFLTAVREAGGVRKVARSDQLFKEVLDRSNDLILNLGKANRAWWQKGFASIPTQFMQIQAKTLESIAGLNGAFTKMERAKLLLGQTALYGTAGVYAGNWMARNILSGVGMDQRDIDNANPALIKLLTGGFTDSIAYLMGFDIVASDRGALLNGMDQTVLSFLTEENTLFNWVGGPSSVLPTRMWEAFRKLHPWMARPQDMHGRTDVSATDVSDTLRSVGEDIIGFVTSPFAVTSQWNKAWLMHDLGVLRDKNGNFIAQPQGGFNLQTVWGAGFGWKPDALQRKFDLSEMNEARREYIQFRTNMLLIEFDKFLIALERARTSGVPMTEDETRRHRVKRQVLVDSLHPDARFAVLRAFRQRLKDRRGGGSQFERQQKTYWDNNFVFPLTDALFDDIRGRGKIADNARIIQVSPPDRKQEKD